MNRLYEQLIGLFKTGLTFLIVLVISTSFAFGISVKDTLFNKISKQKRTEKLLFLPIVDFENEYELTQARAILEKYSLGGVMIGNGHISNVSKWIGSLKKNLELSPLFILDMTDLLTIPLSGLPRLPSPNQLATLSGDSLVKELGARAGKIARSAGFDIIALDSEMETLLDSTAKSQKWVIPYLKGLTSSGITILFKDWSQSFYKNGLYSFLNTNSTFDITSLTNKSGLDLVTKSHNKVERGDEIVFERLESFDDLQTSYRSKSDIYVLPDDLEAASNILDYISDNHKASIRKLKRKFRKVSKLYHMTNSKAELTEPFQETIRSLPKLFHEVLKESVVCLKNEEQILPFRNLERSNFASICGNKKQDTVFRSYLDKYTRVAHYDFNDIRNDAESFLFKLSHFDKIVVKVDQETDSMNTLISILRRLGKESDVIIVQEGEMEEFDHFLEFDALIWTPDNHLNYAKMVPQHLFGAEAINGVLPDDSVGVQSIVVKKSQRLSYNFPEATNVNVDILSQIDEMVKEAVESGSMPGCQINMVKNGIVVYEKSFGYFTYDSLLKIDIHTIYDIASVTKVISTVPAIMHLDEGGKLRSDDEIGKHLPTFKNSNKINASIESLLMHQSGLKSHIPFWKRAHMSPRGEFLYELPSKRRRSKSGRKVAINWSDSIRHWIATSDFNSLRRSDGTYGYLYSDLGFMVLKDAVESKLNGSMGDFLNEHIYGPLGMVSTTYNPLCQFPFDDIVPTERDNHFRHRIVWGKPHDENAALMNTANGHAGLFSNATDLSKFLQMHLWNGQYGGKTYFQPETIKKYTSKPTISERRALGWDKPDKKVGNASRYASDSSYGHTGFTGTMVWVDPKYDFIYIFLSNRTYPDSKNNKLSENNIRTRIHDIMYQSFIENE